jgi:catechol O-methyltransferase
MSSDAHRVSSRVQLGKRRDRPPGDHAGVGDRLMLVVGTLGDGGATVERLESEHHFAKDSVDLIFIDHDKNAYLFDLQLIIERAWLHPAP